MHEYGAQFTMNRYIVFNLLCWLVFAFVFRAIWQHIFDSYKRIECGGRKIVCFVCVSCLPSKLLIVASL